MASQNVYRRSVSVPPWLGGRMLTALFAALAAYCLLSAVLGPAGMIAYRELSARRATMANNLVALGRTNARLQGELDSLKSDADRAAREARGLGYLRPDETEIVISGRETALPPPSVGAVLPLTPPASLSDAAIKEIALAAGLSVFLLGVFRRRRSTSGRGGTRMHRERSCCPR